MNENLLPHPLGPAEIRAYIDFDSVGSSRSGDSSQAILQSRGVAALWQLLQNNGYAYLGDEVGMGKTRQAMGVIATQFLSDPNSHVVIVCPGETLQRQWVREWDAFIRGCYLAKENRLSSAWDGSMLQGLAFHNRLRDFAQSLLLNENRIHLLRYSAFSRPIWFGNADPKKKVAEQVNDVISEYTSCLREIGIPQPTAYENSIFQKFVASHGDGWREEITSLLNEAYAQRVGQLLKARDIDLVIFDEAQYLRHIDNRQNTNIRHVFRKHAAKWLFMSATPLHTGVHDIASLDNYLCMHEDGNDAVKKCPACGNTKCTKARFQLKGKIDVVEILKGFLVRRNRNYQDATQKLYGKVEYRKYNRSKVAASGDPFTALTMALVQKGLVKALSGNNNRFRQGECSSFESLSTSLKRRRLNRDGVPIDEKELEPAGGGNESSEETPDRSYIDGLSQRFKKAMLGSNDAASKTSAQYNLPHAKLNEMTKQVFDLNLRNGSNRKSLIFVRRLDTVDEMLALLLAQYQGEVDRRLELWRDFLSGKQVDIIVKKSLWRSNSFWSLDSDAEDADEDAEVENEIDFLAESEGNTAGLDRAGTLPYFEALKRYKDKNSKNGMLTSFQSRLLVTGKMNSNPFRGFLLARPAPAPQMGDIEVAAIQEVWDGADKCWERFVHLVTGRSYSAHAAEESPYGWLYAKHAWGSDGFWKLATLKRCIFQAFRQSDFLVDLYVMNRFLKQIRSDKRECSLQEKLLWFLGEDRTIKFPDNLETYVEHWKEKIRRWIEYFDLIVDKCLRSDGTKGWLSIYEKVDGAFARMAPVFGRSGRLQDNNAVTQFKFPTHPNVLICTDVLKEGVDLHLFCDEVIHYGVAWTSGDLEQRIGRVDRFGSLISRSIGNHPASQEASMLPRLRVEFPYLDGTLDKYQVERVINEKIKSDLRMDLGKRTDEIGYISIDDLEASSAAAHTPQNQLVFFPVKFSDDSSIRTGEGKVRTECLVDGASLQHLKNSLSDDISARHVALIKSVVVRKKVPQNSVVNTGLLRCVMGIVNRRRRMYLEEEYLIPIEGSERADIDVNEADQSLASVLSNGGSVAVTAIPDLIGFAFSPQWNTLAIDVQIDNPFALDEVRKQVVLLEQVEGFWLLRTPLFKVQGERAVNEIGSEQWLADQNVCRTWGYLREDRGIVWFIAFVRKQRGGSVSSYLTSLAERTGKIGDRLQHLFVAADEPEDWGYRAKSGFPGGFIITHKTQRVLDREGESIMTADLADLQRSGQFISRMQTWFQETFADVLATLYGSVPRGNWSLKIAPMTILPDGVLHLATEGAERFRIQAYLQLADINNGAVDIPSPRLIWGMAVSPNLKGPKPLLELPAWEKMPHANPNDWEGGGNEQCKAYTNKGEKYRYLALYHDPGIMDGSGQRILEIWADVLERMQGNNFMKKLCRDKFIEAISSHKHQNERCGTR